MGEPITNFALFVLLPLVAIILVGGALIMALRGGRPFSFTASGFGVSVKLLSNSGAPNKHKECKHESVTDDAEA